MREATRERVAYLNNWEEARFVDWQFIGVPGSNPSLNSSKGASEDKDAS